MENTLENKAKFFGQYFGVSCLRNEELPNISSLPVMNPWSHGLELQYLELKPLSSISDEDLKTIHKYTFVDEIKSSKINYIANHKGEDITDFEFKFHNGGAWRTRPLKTLEKDFRDELRALGYAIPYKGLSVEELVNRGWVKLKLS